VWAVNQSPGTWHPANRTRHAREVADRIVFFDDGQIVEEAPPVEFFGNPKEERTKLFLSQILTH
jgi:ABC-type polar amino acid transport system ATPase subunit